MAVDGYCHRTWIIGWRMNEEDQKLFSRKIVLSDLLPSKLKGTYLQDFTHRFGRGSDLEPPSIILKNQLLR